MASTLCWRHLCGRRYGERGGLWARGARQHRAWGSWLVAWVTVTPRPFAWQGHSHPLGPAQLCSVSCGEGENREAWCHSKSPLNSSCPLSLDLNLIAASFLLHPYYLFRSLSPVGEILTTWNRSIEENMPYIKLIRKRWGGILQMVFTMYKGKIKMPIIFIHAVHMTYFKWT